MNLTRPVTGGFERSVNSNRPRNTTFFYAQRCSPCLLACAVSLELPTLVQHISSGRDNTQGYSNPTYKFFIPQSNLVAG